MTAPGEQNPAVRRPAAQPDPRVVAGIVGILLIVAAVVIWNFAGLWMGEALAPLPECSPPRGEMISI